MKTLKHLSWLIILSIMIVVSCKKDKVSDPQPQPEPAKPTPYYVSMTDAPGPYTAVLIDLQAVEIKGNGGTVMLNVLPGIYNLLDYANGVDTLIATGSLNMGTVEQIRLILGPNNSVVSGGISYPLNTPSAQQSGLKLQVHQTLQAGVAYYVLLDFDAYQSIVNEGNGSYSLKPVIRTIETALGGAIKGQINPGGVVTNITVSTGTNSYSSAANANGYFIISGIPAGTYTLTATPVSPYNTVTVSPVTVSTGSTTNVGILNI